MRIIINELIKISDWTSEPALRNLALLGLLATPGNPTDPKGPTNHASFTLIIPAGERVVVWEGGVPEGVSQQR